MFVSLDVCFISTNENTFCSKRTHLFVSLDVCFISTCAPKRQRHVVIYIQREGRREGGTEGGRERGKEGGRDGGREREREREREAHTRTHLHGTDTHAHTPAVRAMPAG